MATFGNNSWPTPRTRPELRPVREARRSPRGTGRASAAAMRRIQAETEGEELDDRKPHDAGPDPRPGESASVRERRDQCEKADFDRGQAEDLRHQLNRLAGLPIRAASESAGSAPSVRVAARRNGLRLLPAARARRGG